MALWILPAGASAASYCATGPGGRPSREPAGPIVYNSGGFGQIKLLSGNSYVTVATGV